MWFRYYVRGSATEQPPRSGYTRSSPYGTLKPMPDQGVATKPKIAVYVYLALGIGLIVGAVAGLIYVFR